MSNLTHILNRRLICPMMTGAIVLVLFTAAAATVGAQPLNRYIRFDSPAPTVAHDGSILLGGGRRVAIVRSEQTIQNVPDADKFVEEAVRQWEILLLGLRIPYEVMDDADLERRIPERVSILILPGVESLSEKQRSRIRDFMVAGRGLIASGRTGFYDERGVRQGPAFMEDIFDMKFVEALPAQPHGLFQVINGHSMLTQGIAPGFLLNVHAQQQLSAARPEAGQALGPIRTFDRKDQAVFEGMSLMISGQSLQSRFVWMRFQPQDVSRDVQQQESYQRLVVNTLAYLSRSTTVSVENWPNAKSMALTVAGLPSPGFDPLNYYRNVSQFVEFAADGHVPVSFYLASHELAHFPSLYSRILRSGAEVGLSAEDDRLLVSDSLQGQMTRISGALNELGMERVYGFYPPGGFLNQNTIRALDHVGVLYVLSSDGPALAPDRLDWWRYADYADSFVVPPAEPAADDPYEFLSPAAERSEAGPEPRLPDLATIPLIDDDSEPMGWTFERVRQAGGHYALPFYPELYRPYATTTVELSGVLEQAGSADAWLATASDVLLWWRRREGIRPEIVFLGENEMHIDLEKTSPDTLRNVVLNLYLPDVPQKNVRVTEFGRVSARDPESERLQVALDPLVRRSTRIIIRWDR